MTRLNNLEKEEQPWRSMGLQGYVATAMQQHGTKDRQLDEQNSCQSPVTIPHV